MMEDSAVEIAVYITEIPGAPHQIWVQLHNVKPDFEKQIVDFLRGLNFHHPGHIEPYPTPVYMRNFPDKTLLAETASRLINYFLKLPVKRQFRFCLPSEDNQIFIPSF